LVLSAAALTFGGVTALADWVYWGKPLSSIYAAIDYTLLNGQSSRGYEPVWEYLRIVPAWSTPVFVCLALLGSSRRYLETWWLWVPITLLSLLPHKEHRYLIAVIPFLSTAAERGFVRMAESMPAWRSGPRSHRSACDLVAPLLSISVIHEIGGWSAGARSNEGVRLAQYVRRTRTSGVAAQDFWRLGGRIYLWQHDPLIDFPAAMLSQRNAAATALAGIHWVALRTRTARTVGDPAMQSLGFGRDPYWEGEDYVLYVRRE